MDDSMYGCIDICMKLNYIIVRMSHLHSSQYATSRWVGSLTTLAAWQHYQYQYQYHYSWIIPSDCMYMCVF